MTEQQAKRLARKIERETGYETAVRGRGLFIQVAIFDYSNKRSMGFTSPADYEARKTSLFA